MSTFFKSTSYVCCCNSKAVALWIKENSDCLSGFWLSTLSLVLVFLQFTESRKAKIMTIAITKSWLSSDKPELLPSYSDLAFSLGEEGSKQEIQNPDKSFCNDNMRVNEAAATCIPI